MTKYELVKVLSARVQQLADGATSTLPAEHPVNPVYGNLLDVAVAELEEGKLPMMLPRELPDGTTEMWRLDQLRLPKAFMRHVKSTSIL